jgi:hypothetical protein
MRISGLTVLSLSCGLAAAAATAAEQPLRLAAAQVRSSSECSAGDFDLEDLSSRKQKGYVYIVGRVFNNCDVDTGAQITISILDRAGSVLKTTHYWPASRDNIPAHSGFHFQAAVEGVDSYDRFQVHVTSVKRWEAE